MRRLLFFILICCTLQLAQAAEIAESEEGNFFHYAGITLVQVGEHEIEVTAETKIEDQTTLVIVRCGNGVVYSYKNYEMESQGPYIQLNGQFEYSKDGKSLVFNAPVKVMPQIVWEFSKVSPDNGMFILKL